MKINFRYTTDYDNKDILGDVDMEINVGDADYSEVEAMFHRFMTAIGWSKRPSLKDALESYEGDFELPEDDGWDIQLFADSPPQERDLFDD